MVLLEDPAVFVVRGGADAAQLAVCEGRLDEIRGVHDAPGGRAGADDGVDLIDEENRARLLLDLGEHRLQPLLEVARYLVPATNEPMSNE